MYKQCVNSVWLIGTSQEKLGDWTFCELPEIRGKLTLLLNKDNIYDNISNFDSLVMGNSQITQQRLPKSYIQLNLYKSTILDWIVKHYYKFGINVYN